MAKRRPTRTLLPLPLEPILAVPGLASFPGSVYNAVLTLAIVYWLGGCRPLPAESAELCALVRYAPPRWQRAQPRVLEALAVMLPALASLHSLHATARARLLVNCSKAGHASQAKRKLSALALVPHFTATRSTTAPHTPTKTARYKGDGRTDLNARTATITAAGKMDKVAGLSDAKSATK